MCERVHGPASDPTSCDGLGLIVAHAAAFQTALCLLLSAGPQGPPFQTARVWSVGPLIEPLIGQLVHSFVHAFVCVCTLDLTGGLAEAIEIHTRAWSLMHRAAQTIGGERNEG